jgi:plasmid stabilization system protein ParE
MRVEYHPAIETEINEIRSYYDERSPGLGSEFVGEFERQILALATAPERWMVVTGDIRRCLMRRFPYIVYFRWINSDLIRIVVVKHQRRHPQYGRNRK